MSTNVDLATRHAGLFAEVRAHTLEVIRRRRQGGDWSAAENQYRDAFAEAGRIEQQEGANR